MNPGRIERTTQNCRDGLDSTERKYLVSTGRFALRGIGRAQDLYTLDPDVGADEVVAGSYERYLAP
jgi:adenylate cyclase